MRIYLDYAATTPVDPRVRKAMEPFWTEIFGNASSIHEFGQEALQAMDQGRKQVAALINAKPEEIIFTSGGTEADNTAIKSTALLLRKNGNHIITSAIEHHAVLHTCKFLETQGFEVTYLPVAGDGLINLRDLEKAIKPTTILITIMHANNEIGTIQPVSEIGEIARDRNILFHTDAVQTFGHVVIDVKEMPIDLLSLSAHKVNGPKGIGALYLKEGTPFIPYLHGGGQENGRRATTSNIPGIVGLGKAAEIAQNEMRTENQKIENLRDHLLNKIQNKIDGIKMNGHQTRRLVNNIHLSIDGVEGESLLMNLDLEGIAASSGSACSSGSTEPSHVLTGIGLSAEQARGSLRISLGRFTTEEDVDIAADKLEAVVTHLRSLSGFGSSSA